MTLPDLLRDKFSVVSDSLVVEDDKRGETDNVFNLEEDDLEIREVINIDICEEMFEDTCNEDPTKFRSVKTGRGPLDKKDWMDKANPIITIYKLLVVELEIPRTLIPNRFKAFLVRMVTKMNWKYIRKMICCMDDWINLTLEDIRKLEKECAERLPEEMLKEGKVMATSFI